jgi:hypothetical protein
MHTAHSAMQFWTPSCQILYWSLIAQVSCTQNYCSRTKLAYLLSSLTFCLKGLSHYFQFFYFEIWSITQGLSCFSIQMNFKYYTAFLSHVKCAKHLRRPELRMFCDEIYAFHSESNMLSQMLAFLQRIKEALVSYFGSRLGRHTIPHPPKQIFLRKLRADQDCSC